MRHYYPPDAHINEVPGEWRAEKTFPAANTRKTNTLYLSVSHALAGGIYSRFDQGRFEIRAVHRQ